MRTRRAAYIKLSSINKYGLLKIINEYQQKETNEIETLLTSSDHENQTKKLYKQNQIQETTIY